MDYCEKIGGWLSDSHGLPCFEYTGALPYKAVLADGTDVKLPKDPWFLLGNYQLTLFAHVSGEYELITGQRSWARLNQGAARNSGNNTASVSVDGVYSELIGLRGMAAKPEECRRVFGCGFASYSYAVGNVQLERRLSVKPSTDIADGVPAFVTTVTIKNNGDCRSSIKYTENFRANYQEVQYQDVAAANHAVQYEYDSFLENGAAGVVVTGRTQDPLLAPDEHTISRFDCFPPLVYMASFCGDADFSVDDNILSVNWSVTLGPGERASFSFVTGFSFVGKSSFLQEIVPLKADFSEEEDICSAYAVCWEKVLPDFPSEQDNALRQELRWNAYNLEAMATYSHYYRETKIPQGTIYDYDWGIHASARDNFQHALPLVYYNPRLAKSVVRYMLRRTTCFGEIRLIESGFAYADNERYFTSDQQLFFFLLLSEYLRVTEDFSLLMETVEPYPGVGTQTASVLDMAIQCFVFLRDTVGTGSHGIIRLMNSDWNDTVYYIEKVPYNNIFFSGESHMNSAMALCIFQELIPLLRKATMQLGTLGCEYAEKATRFAESLEVYRRRILDAFLEDLGSRSFPRRMYFNDKPYGDDNMFLEPQGYTLQIAELSEEFKRELYRQMKLRLYPGEKLGARQQERPEFEDDAYDKGSRENGGFWWALNGPVVVGVAEFDLPEATNLLRKMTLGNFAAQFPEYWSSYWSAADNQESSLVLGEGLPDQSFSYANIPVYCAHPHAWILYCYYRLIEKQKS